MAISTRAIANIGSPPGDPTCLLPGILYIPDPEVHPGPWDCVVGTVAGHFTTHQNLNPLVRPMEDLANQGFLCLAFYVRTLTPGIPTQTTTGQWKQQTDDFKIGVQYMRTNPGGFGYEVTGFVAAIGGSGSGHHALYSALDGAVGVDRADAAICMSPATDFSDRTTGISQQFIDKCIAYAGVSDLPTLLARSPIALSLLLIPPSPILHYNGDLEAMPISQLTRFRDGPISDFTNYSSRINTGQLGQVHSFAMWPQIATEAIEWLFQWTGGTPTPPPPPAPPPPVETPIGREGSFRRAFNRVILNLGKDPYKNLPYELTRSVVEHINQRVSVICPIWRWPEWEVTEERAYRQVWNANRQYVNGVDEVFYIPTLKYYAAGGTSASDPPVGSLPTNTAYWTVIANVDTFLEYNQTCKRPMGMVLGVYSQNPRVPTGSMNGRQPFMPSEKGIDVRGTGPTVFVTYKKPVPRYTMTPIASGYQYLKGEVRFDPGTGECYQAVSDNNGSPVTDTTAWRMIPLPQSWENYVVEGAFADALCELDQGGNENIAVNMQLSMQANERANDLLQVAVDTLTIQGQRLSSNVCQSAGYWCESLPWSGGTVTTLTDECEDEVSAAAPTTAPQVRWTYYQDIIALLTETGTPSLQQVVTKTLAVGSRATFDLGTQGKEARLYSGTADPADPGQIQPADYHVTTNQKFWRIVA